MLLNVSTRDKDFSCVSEILCRYILDSFVKVISMYFNVFESFM